MLTFSGILSIIILLFVALIIRSHFLNSKSAEDNKEDGEDQNIKVQNHNVSLEKYKLQIEHTIQNILPFEQKYCSLYDQTSKLKHLEKIVSDMEISDECSSSNQIFIGYKHIINYLRNGELLRTEHNKNFIESESLRLRSYFDTLLAHPLDYQQIDAILHDEDNTLVLAGAGCGKTTTIQGKIKYLINKKLASPEQILVLTFAKKNADDLKSKIAHLGVRAFTFHGLAYQILKKVGSIPSVITSAESTRLINNAHQTLTKDMAYLAAFNDFVLNGLRPIKNQNDFSSYKKYIDYLKDSEFESIKGVLSKRESQIKAKKTIIEFVKNGEECYLANFFFLHGIEYTYNPNYIFQKELNAFRKLNNNYRPTFAIYLNGYNEELIKTSPNPEKHILYLDHLCIEGLDSCPRYFAGIKENSAEENFKSMCQSIDELHQQYKTHIIKSYSYEFKEKTIEENLISNLILHGVKFSPKSNVEVYSLLEEAYGKEIDAVVNLFQTVITLLKSNNKSFSKLARKNEQQFKGNHEFLIRNKQFLEIVEKIFREYQNELKRNEKIDFNDLINLANSKIKTNQFKHRYSYIIVDEFQDISINRYSLLHALKTQQYCKLFAVGDDWQSIYRFAGSDLTLFNKFENFLGYTITKKIETTYRFAEPMISISSKFILKNPHQKHKQLRSYRDRKTELLFEFQKDNSYAINQSLLNILNNLYIEYGDKIVNKSITLIGRYNHDIDQIKPDVAFNVQKKESFITINTTLRDVRIDSHGNVITNNQLRLEKKISFLTTHKAKGLESDIVILINCNTGKYGFPSELSDDKILTLLLNDSDEYINAEERRAFYVAMTRAKDKFVFLVKPDKLSKFVNEIYDEFTDTRLSTTNKVKLCDRCFSELRYIKEIHHKWGTSKMYGCINFKYGCDYVFFTNNASE